MVHEVGGGGVPEKQRDIGAEFAETGFDDLVGGYRKKKSKKRGEIHNRHIVINETA